MGFIGAMELGGPLVQLGLHARRRMIQRGLSLATKVLCYEDEVPPSLLDIVIMFLAVTEGTS